MTARRRLTVLALLAPAVLGFAAFFGYPLVATVVFSFTRYDLINPPEWIGLANYEYMLGDELFARAVGNTLWFVVVLTATRVVFALGVASVIARLKSGVGLVRTLCYLPSLAPPVAATLVFFLVLRPNEGPVDTFLGWLGVQGPLWFADPAWAKPGIAAVVLWVSGDLMIIVLAAILDVPREQYEAAELDGAGPLRRWWHITLPSISPVLLFGVVNSIILALQLFTQAVVAGSAASGSADVTGSTKDLGFPENSTLTFPVWLYAQGFRYFDMGYAAAMATVLFAVSFLATALLVQRMRRATHQEEGA
ncbi:carbohydrate ABC transporter permease [Saccharothrix coeruleofusca]|uniref:Sugar ABC transporter permease n=1 Tax=Saccharothrix coeruleofusca TaxID=33919 RepID=A0A918AFZ7_9PSEU|nr:sugar ABC transporter permease [Saccharothrix coeruleofusca]MBP2340439.1 multiple sugar transport system permease protein [Saccharothrix coeruleofusca]GGP35329.1 sugar ABC transporter permease [Saccharothrix coeruleofusca]